MATSSIQRTAASGSTAVFSVPFPYIDKSHVQVRVDGVLLATPADYTWPTSSTIQLTAGNPTAGTVVERRRATPVDPLTNFSSGNLDSGDLNASLLQPLYVAQEGADAALDALTRAWFTANYGDGGTITIGANGTTLMWNADGDVVEGPSADDIVAAEAAALAAQASATASAQSAADAAAAAATTTPVATQIHAAAAKTTPVDADELGLADSAASWGLKKVTWANLKATLKAYFDPIYAPISVAFANLAAAAVATTGEYRVGSAASKLLSITGVNGAMAEVALTDATTIAWDMSTGIDFTVTLTASRTLGNPSNTVVGRRGRIRVVQNATGGWTLTKSSNHKTAGGGNPLIATAANAESYLYYDVVSSTKVLLSGSPLAWS
jgi:hypothetical protein